MTDLICIVCPQGCRLKVDEQNDYAVTGNRCTRGITYGKKELQNPTRVVTSTVLMKNSNHKTCPVKTNKDIPKAKVKGAVKALEGIVLVPPVKVGQVLVENVLETGANFVATKNVLE